MSSAPSTILVIGATGNTGQSVVRNLSALLDGQAVRILGLTRSTDTAASKELAALPLVEMEAKNWPEISIAWLRDANVVKAYVASHNEPDQFADESGLYAKFLQAGVKYVVRVSTFQPYMGPDSQLFVGRTHWAVEKVLQSPEYAALHWTSLRPNYFSTAYLGPAVQWAKEVVKIGQQTTLKMMLKEDVKVACIDPSDVGLVGARLLALDDPSQHNQGLYVLNGPADVTGRDVVDLIEKAIGEPVKTISFANDDWLTAMKASGGYPPKIIGDLEYAVKTFLRGGKASNDVTQTSKEVLDMVQPRSVSDTFKALYK